MSEPRLNGFVLVAHRGNSSAAPENTVISFESALDAGFPHFETDCQLTADSAVVILHDEQLGRTTPTARGAVAEAAWADLQDLDAGSWLAPEFVAARIPLLSEVLERYRGRAHIHLELKSTQPELPARVAQELRRAGGWLPEVVPEPESELFPEPEPARPLPGSLSTSMQVNQPIQPTQPTQQPQHPQLQEGQSAARDEGGGAAAVAAGGVGATAVGGGARATYPHQPHQPQTHPAFAVPGLTLTSFHLNQLRRSLQLLPGVIHGWLVHELTDDVVQEALASGCRQVCPRADVLKEEGVRRAIAAGLSVRAWGVRNMQLLFRTAQCGCHGATVNWPTEARRELLQQRRPPPPPLPLLQEQSDATEEAAAATATAPAAAASGM